MRQDALKKIILAVLAITIIFLMSNVVSVFAQPQPNPTGNCLNLAGAATPCKPYIDIVSSDVSMSNGAYTGTITLAGTVPNSSATYLEWDIAIDADRNPNTNPVCAGIAGCTYAQSNLIFDGIGVDYLIVYNLWNNPCASSSAPCAFIYDGTNFNPLSLQAKVHGNTIQLFWKPSDIRGSTFFDFVVLAGVYSDSGYYFSQLLSFDKAPNVGHYEFQGGNVTAVPELTATPIVAFVLLIMSFGVLNYHKKLRRSKCL